VTLDNPTTEITLGVCDNCENYVPFIRLNERKDARVFKCLSCNHQYEQLVNGKVQFLHLDEIYKLAK
jgi:RNA polymerase-binding transcription factor DksA